MAAGNATFANESVTMADGNAAFAGGMCLLRMETPLRGRSGGHTGAAPTISRVARFTRLPARCSPTDKNEEGCVAEGFDGGWWGRCLCARPCRPTRAHPSITGVHHAQCTNISTHGDASFAGGERALCGWKRLLYGWGCALCGWKRRCADVRAGTQAPPLPFLVWLHVLRLPANSSPTDKNKKCMPARCLPMD